ncbi:MAG: GNAT family N-acetyltransferase [Spirochaetia bacterium]|nr:GNAT family N-acetyltransferase [Spirochaetia bacterium]
MKELLSVIDSERFGFSVAKVDDFSAGPEKIIGGLKGLGVRLIIGRQPTSETGMINKLEDLGFRLMDTQVTYRHDIRDWNKNPSVPDGYVVRPYADGDIEAVMHIAGGAFDFYSHYAADKRLDVAKVRQIYPDWAQRSCLKADANNPVFIAALSGEIAGFITFRTESSGRERYGVCGLGAVAEGHRKIGLYQALISNAMEWGRVKGLAWEQYTCIACNYPANRSYIAAGFKPVYSFATLHYWQD